MPRLYCARLQKVCAFLLLSLSVLGCAPDQDAKTLRIAHTLNEDHPVHRAMQYMGERLALHSNGTMTLDIYPNGQLGNERELIELAQIGAVSMSKVSSISMEGFSPDMKVFNIPYIFNDNAHYWQVLEGPVGRELLDSLSPVLLKGMGYYDAGSRSFYMSASPVLTPDDLIGKKVRVLSSRTSIEMVEAMGGAATPMSSSEIYTALQQGVIDGAENNPPTYYLSKEYEIAPHYALDEHTSVPDIVIISLEVWNRLSTQEQQWLQKAMDESVTYQRALWKQVSDDALAAVTAAGSKVYYPDKAPFQEAVKDLKAGFSGTDVGVLLERIDAIGKQTGSSTGANQ